ncbi:hypothetical protein VAWG006_13050 [Aeromonas enteropelogenes]|nr:hypothetical protein VAWG006_13050 [Aeromonas enteropelogenes]BEE21217.1 hypothetical protein VAWG007_13120 [Aeromonas enteropelogenes]
MPCWDWKSSGRLAPECNWLPAATPDGDKALPNVTRTADAERNLGYPCAPDLPSTR